MNKLTKANIKIKIFFCKRQYIKLESVKKNYERN